MIDFRLPTIKGLSAEERTVELEAYMYQLVESLNWAMNTNVYGLDQVDASGMPSASKDPTQIEQMFAALKNRISQSPDISNAVFSNIRGKMDQLYVKKKSFDEYEAGIEERLTADENRIEDISSDVQGILSTDVRSAIGIVETGTVAELLIDTYMAGYNTVGIVGVETGNDDLSVVSFGLSDASQASIKVKNTSEEDIESEVSATVLYMKAFTDKGEEGEE